MKNKNIYNRLSNSAKITLDEYLEELRDEILFKAEKESKAENFSSSEIRLKDLISAIRSQNPKGGKVNQLSAKKKRLYQMVTMVGLLYTLVGIGYYLYTSGLLNIKENVGLIIAILGIMISIMGYFFTQFTSHKNKFYEERKKDDSINLEDKNYELFKRWQIVENQTREILEKDKNHKTANFSDIMNYLITSYASNQEDKNKIRELLSARNKIAHEGFIENKSELLKLIEYSDILINKLDENLK